MGQQDASDWPRRPQTTPSMKEVSKCWISVRMNDISLRALSNMTLGSDDTQRRQFGAITMAKLLASIFVTEDTSVCEKICKQIQMKRNETTHTKRMNESSYLEETNEIRENEAVDLGQPVDDSHGAFRIRAVGHTLVVQFIRNQRFVQLPVPQLEQRGRNMGVAYVAHLPLIHADLEAVHFIHIRRHSAQQR